MPTCMIRKWGLLTFSPTEQNRSWTRRLFAFTPLMRYLLRPPMTTCTTQTIHSLFSNACFKDCFFLWTMFSDLSCNGYLIMRLKPQRTLFLVGVVESDGHCSLGDASQTIFVHQILEISGTNLQGLQTSRITLWLLIKICIFLKTHVHYYYILKILKSL